MRTLIPGFTTTRIEYPSTIGMPGVEGDVHQDVFQSLWLRMKCWAKRRGDCYFGGGLFVYYSEDEPQVRLAPDGFVAFGVSPDDRKHFMTWEERTAPSVVFEIVSRSTLHDDLRTKRAVYQDVWEVDEYFLFDPFEDQIDPSLQGFRRVRGAFQPIKPSKDRSLVSRRLGLILDRDRDRLRLRDSTTGATILTEAETRIAEQDAEIALLLAENVALKKKK